MSSSYDPTRHAPVADPASFGPGPSFEPAGGSPFAPTPASRLSAPGSAPPTAPDPRQLVADPYGQPSGPPPAPPTPPRYGQDPYAAAGPYAPPATDRYGLVAPAPYASPGGASPYGQPPNLYGSYDSNIYGVYGYQAPARSKTTAALLAFFLGHFGAHSFYLGKKGLGFAHLALGVGGWVLMILMGVLATANPGAEDVYFGLVAMLWLLPVINGFWAFIEFIIILVTPEYQLGR